uniref:Condensation domain-containing protein n=1 Tax=Phaeomonas parva TaxID=124430 RepID=A0A7S1XW13_9STRA|mmetsp:Transcript_39026/g.122204  ORF Transcript_39026/g.122204 Transcript_39026/m.122204 type:complete len:421 (+) Transcript_39026:211-1473(+)
MAAPVAPDDVVDVALLKDEGGGLLYEEGITTITFYRGDFGSAKDALRAQLGVVVAANPWLTGRLVKSKTGVSLRHSPSPSVDSVDAIFDAEQGLGVDLDWASATYAEVCTALHTKPKAPAKRAIIGSGTSLVGKDEPVARLTLAEAAPGEFALVWSLSHAVGDGRTYYEIFSMLRPGAPVRALSSARVQSFSEAMRDMCNREALTWADKPWTAVMYMSTMAFNGPATCRAFYLDDERVAAFKTKGAADGGVPYVTTNDLLTSGFFTVTGARIGMMGLDCRGRVEGVGADLAGNYVTALVLDDTVFETPAALRRMYASTPYATTGRKLPSCCCGGEARFAMATNWSSFADPFALEGCEMRVHLPVKNPAHCVFDLMIPFAAGGGRKGVICWTLGADEAALREALPIGASVSDVLFPAAAST